ncbi:hypothetical protein [Nocardioides sp. L-11A]|uniref:hypothetical protein n=1 Tax=Nocardioides sp. L-11A TaxID=3043848 RepID=UPI00249BB951|nr:hypothetical protein QJ852_15310 [Nocardioides sp. L-11A]
MTNTYKNLENQILAGAKGITAADLASAYFADRFNELVLRRQTMEATARRDAAANADAELAEFVAQVLRDSAYDLRLPLDTKYAVGDIEIEDGVPTIVVKPLAPTEHTGTGTASGKVSVKLHNLGSPVLDTKMLRDLMAKHSLNGNLSFVDVGNFSQGESINIVTMKHALLDNPVVPRPSADGLAHEIVAFAKRGRSDTVGRAARVLDTTVVASDEQAATVRGTIAAYSDNGIRWTLNEIVNEIRPFVERRSGLAPNLGVIEKIEISNVRPWSSGPGGASGAEIEFTATARSRRSVN